MPTIAAKLRSHIERADQMSDCINPLLWMDDEGLPETYIWLGEIIDGLRTLTAHIATAD
jgi:hypothetical protein